MNLDRIRWCGAALIALVLVAGAVIDFLTYYPRYALNFEMITAFAVAIFVLLFKDFEFLSVAGISAKPRVEAREGSENEAEEKAEEELRAEERVEGPTIPDGTVDSYQSDSKEKSFTRSERVQAILKLEQKVMQLYCAQYLPSSSWVPRSPFVIEVDGLSSPVKKSTIQVDGYLETEGTAIFLEVKRFVPSIGMRRDFSNQLYRMIDTVEIFARNRKLKAKLVILVPLWPAVDNAADTEHYRSESAHTRFEDDTARLRREFSGAVEAGLLEIIPIRLSQNDIEGLEAAAPPVFKRPLSRS